MPQLFGYRTLSQFRDELQITQRSIVFFYIGSKPSHLSRGKTRAFFRADGKTPCSREWLMILVIIGRRIPKHSKTSFVGIGSKEQVFFLDVRINSCTSSWDNWSNESRTILAWHAYHDLTTSELRTNPSSLYDAYSLLLKAKTNLKTGQGQFIT